MLALLCRNDPDGPDLLRSQRTSGGLLDQTRDI